jgi:hypothetical protein
MSLLQVSTPQAVDLGGQVQVIQLALDFIEVEGAYIGRPAVRQRLAQQLKALKRVSWVDLMGDPDDVAGDFRGHRNTISQLWIG